VKGKVNEYGRIKGSGGREREENNLHFDIHDTVFLYSSTRDKNKFFLLFCLNYEGMMNLGWLLISRKIISPMII